MGLIKKLRLSRLRLNWLNSRLKNELFLLRIQENSSTIRMPWRLWVGFILFIHEGCHTKRHQPLFEPLPALHVSQQSSWTLDLGTILFVVQIYFLVSNLTCVLTMKSLVWEMPTKISYRFCQPLSYVYNLEALPIILSF